MIPMLVIAAIALEIIGMERISVWLLLPIDATSDHFISHWQIWHARLMVLAWGFAVPIGVFAARFFKVAPSQDWPHVLDNKVWWHAHRVLLVGGISCATISLAVALANSSLGSPRARMHAPLGWLVMALGWTQIASGMLRGTKGGPTLNGTSPGDHFDMTRRRRAFEYFHKSGGYIAIIGSIVAIILGLATVNAPRWICLALLLWWLCLGLLFVWLQEQGMCIDTYQAIWGPDPTLPGNRVPPIGWGIHRPFSLSASNTTAKVRDEK
jgi:hypothetical protein